MLAEQPSEGISCPEKARVVGERRDVCRTDVDGNERKNRKNVLPVAADGLGGVVGKFTNARTRRAERRRMGGGER